MIQELIAIIIVSLAVIYTITNTIKFFANKNEQACNCSSCDFKKETKDLIINKKIN